MCSPDLSTDDLAELSDFGQNLIIFSTLSVF